MIEKNDWYVDKETSVKGYLDSVRNEEIEFGGKLKLLEPWTYDEGIGDFVKLVESIRKIEENNGLPYSIEEILCGKVIPWGLRDIVTTGENVELKFVDDTLDYVLSIPKKQATRVILSTPIKAGCHRKTFLLMMNYRKVVLRLL